MTRIRILLTGADGLVGSHILDQLLGQDTVSIRAIVGTQQTASTLRQQYIHLPSSSFDLQSVAEQDLRVPGVLDEVLSDGSEPFQAIVYTCNATPFDEADCLARYVNLETERVISFLMSVKDVAKRVGRVVIVTTLTPFARWLAIPPDERWSPGYSMTGPTDSENILATSQASDNVVHDAVSKWAKENSTSFDIVWVTAPSVYGPAVRPLDNSSDLLEANRRIWNICYREARDISETSPYGLSHFLDVRDFAAATIRALFTERASNKRFVISAGTMPSGSEIAHQLVARFPELENSVRFEGGHPQPDEVEDSSLTFLDSYLIQHILGIAQFNSAEKTLVDTTQQILDLLRRKTWRSIIQS